VTASLGCVMMLCRRIDQPPGGRVCDAEGLGNISLALAAIQAGTASRRWCGLSFDGRQYIADCRARSTRASSDHPCSGRIRLDAMFTANASTVALKKNEIAPCRVVSRRIVLLVIWTSDTWAVIATTSE
jgi:hypothetical protein